MNLQSTIKSIVKGTTLSIAISVSTVAHAQQQATIIIGSTSNLIINKNIYGQFAEHLGRLIYGGLYSNGKIRMDIVDALKRIHVPNLRWPGGCFADRYHWRDGIGPLDTRPLRTNTAWGMVPENNSFGTDEYLRLCSLIGCDPYIAGNMGTGTPQEMNDWIEYVNFGGKSELTEERKQNGHSLPYSVRYFGVGNESWGCGGTMTPEYYSNLFKQYSSFLIDYPGAPLFKIASGPFNYDFNWTETFMKNVPLNLVDGLSLHYYTIPTQNWSNKGSATSFSEHEYFTTMWQALRMDYILSTDEAIMDRYDPKRKVALVVDEWGVWANTEPGTDPAFLYQQNSLRDALVAASTLNIFNNHCSRVRMACLAQAVNVLQSLILTKGDSMLLTPTYHVFDLYKVHQDATFLPVTIQTPYWRNAKDSVPCVSASASRDKSGVVHISMVNLHPKETISIKTLLPDVSFNSILGQILTSEKVTDINTFQNPNKIVPKKFSNMKKDGNDLVLNLPPSSVVVIEVK